MTWPMFLAELGGAVIGSFLGLIGTLLLGVLIGKKLNATSAAVTTTPAASLRLVKDDDERGSAS